MRRSIRLTGRKQLSQTAFGIQLADVAGKRVATLSIRDVTDLKAFPPEAEIRVKLVENKLVQVLKFGTIGRPSSSAELTEASFRAPSCQVRIVSRAGPNTGMLLGSTSPWTLKADGDPDGILLFQPADIKPRLWKLDIRESGEERPILYVDQDIPDASIWAKSDPVFSACVLPVVVTQIMSRILSLSYPPEDGWEAEWVAWATSLMPGSKPPFGASDIDRDPWLDDLISTFAQRHNLAGGAITALNKAG